MLNPYRANPNPANVANINPNINQNLSVVLSVLSESFFQEKYLSTEIVAPAINVKAVKYNPINKELTTIMK
jgi:hypothetical protein